MGTSEYEVLGPEGPDLVYLESVPPPTFFPPVKAGAKKTLVIVDDFELKELPKTQRANLDRLVGHVSTHRNVSVMIAAQEFFNIPPIARRCASVMVLWKPRDVRNLYDMSARTGENLEYLFTLAPGQKDSIWIDNTGGSPAPLRKNGYENIPRQVTQGKKAQSFVKQPDPQSESLRASINQNSEEPSATVA